MQQTLRIGEVLTAEGVITPSQLDEALQLQQHRDGRICQILMSLGYLTEGALLECLAHQPGPGRVSAEPYVLNPQVTAFVPKHFALRHAVMPVDRNGGTLHVALGGQHDPVVLEQLESSSGLVVREILCAASAVQTAIMQYYSAEEPPAGEGTQPISHASMDLREWGGATQVHVGPEIVRLRNVLLIVESLDQFPLLPDTHVRLLEALDDPNVDLHALIPLIEQDPTLSANVLRVANTVAYATRDGLATVGRAIVFLGMRQLQHIVLASAVLRQLSARAEFDLAQMFRNAYRCGLLTKVICEATTFGDADVAFTAGLLADLGQIALHIYSREYVAVISGIARSLDPNAGYMHQSRSIAQVEESVLGIAASELGFQLARHWKLPEPLASTIRFHDRLDRAAVPPPLALTVAMARFFLHRDLETGGFGNPEREPDLAWLLSAMDCDPALLPHIEEQYRTTVKHLVFEAGTRG